MNRDIPKLSWINNSGLGCWLSLLLMGLLLGSVGLGWLVNGFLIIVAILLVLPIISWLVFRWWLQRNLIVDQCPVCQYEFTGLAGSQCQCPSCGELLKVESGRFSRFTPPGTIDVEAVDVEAKQLEE
ncbi:MAG: hypothetical protein QNJ54_18135 [Prochloraceae cyanobacterium]|nr:hypothetical protein [Prochloraceae cyanobacterium]